MSLPILEPTDPRNVTPRWMVLSGEPAVIPSKVYSGKGSALNEAKARKSYLVVMNGNEYTVFGRREAAKLIGCSIESIGFHLNRRDKGIDCVIFAKDRSKVKIYKL